MWRNSAVAEPSTPPGAGEKLTRGKLGEKVGSGSLFSHWKDLGLLQRVWLYAVFDILCVVYYHEEVLFWSLPQLYLQSSGFNLRDPNCHLLKPTYQSLHDPNLKQHFYRPDIHKNLKERHLITNDDMVGNTVIDILNFI